MKEIERKFRLREVPDLPVLSATAIKQGYITLPDDSVEARLRQKGDAFFLTFKRGAGLVREEAEVGIGRDEFDRLWPLTQGRRIEKVRRTVSLENDLTAEIDTFEGTLTGLLLCEVEFTDEALAREFLPPHWFGADVTEDGRYKNKSLAVKGIPA